MLESGLGIGRNGREKGGGMPRSDAETAVRDAMAAGIGPRPIPRKGAAATDRLVGMHMAAESLGVSHGHVKNLVRSGRLTSVKLGTRRLIRRSDLIRFIAGLSD